MEDRKVIIVRGTQATMDWALIEQIQDAVLAGYRVPEEGLRFRPDSPQLRGVTRTVTLYAKDAKIVSPMDKSKEREEQAELAYQQALANEQKDKELQSNREPLLEELSTISTKKDLLEFADKIGIDVPEDKKAPKAIEAYIRNSLN